MQLNNLSGVALAIVILVFVVAIGATMLGTLKGTQTASSMEANITDAGLGALEVFGDWFEIIVIVVVLAVILGLFAMYQMRA